jgi:hypothetical protein
MSYHVKMFGIFTIWFPFKNKLSLLLLHSTVYIYQLFRDQINKHITPSQYNYTTMDYSNMMSKGEQDWVYFDSPHNNYTTMDYSNKMSKGEQDWVYFDSPHNNYTTMDYSNKMSKGEQDWVYFDSPHIN